MPIAGSPQPVEQQGLDQLTGLLGRALFRERAEKILAESTSPDQYPALLALDLDRFKTVNDSVGHDVGDTVLKRVAKRLRTAVGPDAITARISGDEFAVLLPSGSDASTIAARLLDLVSRPYAINGHAISITASIGVARSPTDGTDAVTLIQAANIALHQAEKEGRNRQRAFEVSMQDRIRLRAALENDLRAALALQRMELRQAMAMDQFVLEYQPQVELASERLVGFEALLRWQHPVRGLLSPDSFVPLAEEIGLISSMGYWVLRCACRAAAKWPEPSSGKPLLVSVNVSALQLREGNEFVSGVSAALAESGLPPARLLLEITETAVCDDLMWVLRQVVQLGVHLSLDDFGTGFSSLSQLSQCPVDQIKIDRSFIHDLSLPDRTDGLAPTGPRATRAVWMLRAIAGMGGGLGIATVAEGVETLTQANVVRLAGVNIIQGYVVGVPVAEAQVRDVIARFSQAAGPKGAGV